MPKRRTTPCSLTGSWRRPRKSIGWPKGGRPRRRVGPILRGGGGEGGRRPGRENLAGGEAPRGSGEAGAAGARFAEGEGEGEGKRARTPAHSGLPCANLRNSWGSWDQRAKRRATVRWSNLPTWQ